MTGAGTGIGSMPGDDIDESVRAVVDLCPDLVHLPELADRGAPAGMIGRTAALLSGMSVDLQPAGWRLTDAPGMDQRRARSLLARDLDALEEHTQEYAGRLKLQVAGPWTMAALVERPRGDKVLADHGARRDLAQSLAEGLREHISEVARRVPSADLVVQVDEPMLPQVLAAQIRTASGFGRHRAVQPASADEALQWFFDAITESDATPVVHCCADDVPVELLVKAGARAVSFDLSRIAHASLDQWAQAFQDGVDLWPGLVASTEPVDIPSTKAIAERVETFFGALGFGAEAFAPRLVVTPTCGLAGADPGWARTALETAQAVATTSWA